MPIPVIPDHYLCQVVIPFLNSPEANGASNTFYFHKGAQGSFSAVADDIALCMNEFYGTVNTPGTAALITFMSPVIDKPNIRYKVYDLGSASPRTPLIRTPTITPALGAVPLPNEVAAVLSFRSDGGSPTGGTIDKRKRGRVYIGPLQSGVLGTFSTTTDQDAELISGFRNALAGSAIKLRSNTHDLEWRQYSRVANVMTNVTGGFVNNAFDTQRRRGFKGDARTLWP